jgi:hypothetical protein
MKVSFVAPEKVFPGAFSFQKEGIEFTTLYAILGTHDEGTLVLAFERDHWSIP